jgi:glycosyltransferase involved in cell wall biosynthesis
LIVLSGVPDTVLTELYRNAAFCLFPSLYEGYGLPAVEAFAFGKAVIASTGGALPEVVGDFSPCLDPRDEDAWFETMRNWIADPAARAPFETAIRERFRHPTWSEAAELFFAAIDAELASPAAAGTTA